jgi:TP901 family phage tail tape measure protein
MARELVVRIVADPTSLERGFRQAQAATETFGESMNRVGARVAGVGQRLTQSLTVPIGGVAVAATKMALDFERSMEQVRTQAGASQAEVDRMSRAVLDLAKTVPQGPEELAQALFHVESVGYRGARALEVLRTSAQAAAVGHARLEDVTNALVAALKTGIAGTESMRGAVGLLNAIIGAGNMRMGDLAGALSTGVLPAAKAAGLSLRDVGAALDVMTDRGVPAQQAATRLRMTFALLEAPSHKAQDALEQMGIGAGELAEKLRSGGLIAAVEDLRKHYDAVGNATKANQLLLQAFGGGRSAAAIQTLVQNLGALKQKYEEVGAGASKFGADVAATQHSAAYRIQTAWSSIRASLIQLGTTLAPVAAKIADWAARIAQAFSGLSPHVRTLIFVVGGAAAALGPVISVVGGAISVFGTLATVVGAVFSPIGLVIGAIALLAGGIAAAVLAPTQFQHVLERMGMSAKTAGEVVGDLRAVFRAVEAVVKAVWPAISLIVGTALKNLVSAIKIFMDILHGNWGAAWHETEAVLSRTAHAWASLIKMALTGVEKLLGLAANSFLKLAEAIGKAILDGVLKPIANLAKRLWNTIADAINSVIHGIVAFAEHAAERIGQAIADGVVHGVGGLASSLAGKVSGAVSSALGHVGSFLGIGSPSRVTAERIGKPLAEGIIQGYLLGIQPLAGRMSSSIRAALEQARATVRSLQGTLEDAWRRLADNVIAAFDAETRRGLDQIRRGLDAQLNQIDQQLRARLDAINARFNKPTPAEKQLANLDAQQQAIQNAKALKDAQDQLTQAQDQYNQALAGGDPAQIAAAYKQLQDAEYQLAMVQMDIQRQALEQQAKTERAKADQERKAAEERAKRQAELERRHAREHATRLEDNYRSERELQRKHLEAWLKAEEKMLATEKVTWQKAHQDLMRQLQRYGVDYQRVGKDLGESLAKGLLASIKDVEAAAKKLADAVAKYLPHSPAETGPLSRPPDWAGYLTAGLPQALARVDRALAGWGPLATPTSRSVSPGGSSATLAAAAGGDVHVHFHGPVYGGDKHKIAEELALPIRDQLLRHQRRGVKLGFTTTST